MLARIKKGQQKPEIRTRNLEAIRDFLDINDVCHYIVFLALFGNKGEIYNICRGKGYSIRSVLTELMAIAKLQNIKIIEDNKNSRSKITYSLGSSKKLHSIAKSYVPVSLRRSLAQTYSYYFNNV
jgi:GDP-4-dehydro-6-deoxy-D-mannose reductase